MSDFYKPSIFESVSDSSWFGQQSCQPRFVAKKALPAYALAITLASGAFGSKAVAVTSSAASILVLDGARTTSQWQLVEQAHPGTPFFEHDGPVGLRPNVVRRNVPKIRVVKPVRLQRVDLSEEIV